jgi:hypothetical protein
MATSSYDNLISTLESTINYNLAEIDFLERSTNIDDIERAKTLRAENDKINEGITQINANTSEFNENVNLINDLTSYTTDILNSESILTSDRLAKMKNESTNKMRMVEINNYYANKYNDQSEIMKIIILTCIIVLFLWYVNNIVQSSIFYVLIAVVVAVSCVVIFWKSYYLILRNNIDYDQFDFDIKSDILPKIDTTIPSGSSGPTRLSAGDTGAKNCANADCCIAPEYYSFKTAKCYSSILAAAYA